MAHLLRTGSSAVLVVLIMFLGSLGLWLGAPILWLFIGGRVQGATNSLGLALLVSFVGVVATIVLLAAVLSRLSGVYRQVRLAEGRRDPGHGVLETVLVVSAGFTAVVFGIWFLFIAGASPVPGFSFGGI